jgi:uncharacterized protein with GYD domain
MPLYMYQGAYTSQSWAAQVKNPQKRIETVGRQSCEAVGGKLVGAWYCFGDFDFVLIADVPNNESMTAISLAVAAGGAIKSSRTTPLNNGRSDRGGHEEGSRCSEGLPAGYVNIIAKGPTTLCYKRRCMDRPDASPHLASPTRIA